MVHREICRLVGFFFLGYSGVLLLPLLVSAYYQYFVDPLLHPQPHATNAFLATIGVCLFLGTLLALIGSQSKHIYWRESLILATSFWLLAPAIATLPFLFSGTLSNPIQAYFETVSGFTTTGSTIMEPKQFNPTTGEEIKIEKRLPTEPTVTYSYYGTIHPIRNPGTGVIEIEGIEAVGQGLLFWRGLTQSIGGIGIVVLFLAILPMLGIGGKVLLFAEMPGPIKDMWTPRVKETIIELSKIYLGLTLLQIFLLHYTNPAIGWIESCTLAFATLATGGFSPRNDSIASYHNTHTEMIVLLFMLLGSLNFTLYFHMLRGRLYRLYDPELFTYLLTLLVGIGLFSWYLAGAAQEPQDLYSVRQALRYGTFQFISAITSTGFATADYNQWPYSPQLMLIIAMFLGGMSGSTAGGMKTIRQYISFHVIQNRVESMFRPGAVRTFIVAGREVNTSIALTTLSFLVVLAFFTVLGWLLLVLSGIGIWTALGAVTACINNAGLGFGAVSSSFACLSNYQLLICSILMLFGRLEFFAFLVLLVPAFWRESS